jgi:Flp pilus assembly protein TadG
MRVFTPPHSSVPGQRRSGAISIELILAVPILLIATVGVFELGNIVGAANQVVLAARNGALVASAAGSTGMVQTAVDNTLTAAGISTSGVVVSTTPLPTGNGVQVTVAVPLQNTCPDFLKTYGFTLVGMTATVTAVMPLNP